MSLETPAPDVFGFEPGIVALFAGLQQFLGDPQHCCSSGLLDKRFSKKSLLSDQRIFQL